MTEVDGLAAAFGNQHAGLVVANFDDPQATGPVAVCHPSPAKIAKKICSHASNIPPRPHAPHRTAPHAEVSISNSGDKIVTPEMFAMRQGMETAARPGLGMIVMDQTPGSKSHAILASKVARVPRRCCVRGFWHRFGAKKKAPAEAGARKSGSG
jgi:hypothetical protein